MRRALPVLALLCVLALSASPSALAQGPVLRVAVPALPATLDPATALEGELSLIARQVFDTLVQYREGSSDIEPGLAVQWWVSRDGLSWSFRLREGVRFHDGTRLTAHHVVDSLERQISPNHPFAPNPNAVAPRLLRGAPGVVKEIRVADARTVEIRLLLPYAPLLNVLAHPAFSVVLPAIGGARWQGTGAFRIAEALPETLTLEANPGYWGGAPRMSRVVFLTSEDEAAAATALETGTVDLLIPAGVPPRLEGALSVPGWRVGYLALHAEKEPLSRAKVRRALAQALDTALLAPALGQMAVPLQSFLPIGVWARRDGPPLLEANPQGARRLLTEAGFARGAAATLIAADGGGPLEQARLAEAVRSALGAAGLTVPMQLESPEAVGERTRNGEHEMAVLEARVEAGDPHFLLYPLSASEGATRGPSAVNVSFYRNQRLDDLLIRGSQLSFRPERQKVYLRAQSIMAEEMPWIPLYVRLHWVLVRPEVRNLRLHPSGNHRLDRVWLEPGPARSR